MFGFKKKRRKRLMAQRLSADRIQIIRKNVPYYSTLPAEDREALQGLIHVFLREKKFEGCGGLEITDEIRLTIAAQACILILGRPGDFYPTLRTILVYPKAYVAPVKHRQTNGILETEGLQHRLGESWSHGSIVISWDDVVRGASDIHDGHNLIFHEFAHQLDLESGATNGAPILPERSMYISWARVLSREYKGLIDSIMANRPSLLDKYGATNPAEFFAVVTEYFFEKPIELKSLHPELYEQLQLFFGRDPASFS